MKATNHPGIHGLSAPAGRALVNAGIKTVKDLSVFSEKEILKLHGVGPSSIPTLKKALQSAGLHFKKPRIQNANNISAYIASVDEKVRPVLITLRQLIEKTIPDAVGSISYGMPAYKYRGKPLAYFAANKNHAGFYPTPGAISAFEKELEPYVTSKGAVQFPYNQKLPLLLITKMVRFRAEQIDKNIKTK